MEYAILGIAYGLCLFILPLLAYRRGLQDGLNVQQGKPVEPLKTPVQVVKEYRQAKEEQKKTDVILEGLANILAYDGEPQAKGGEKR